jgi:hypothetical protein
MKNSYIRDIHDDGSTDLHLNFHQISQAFREVFLDDTERRSVREHFDQVIQEASQYFYVQCKQDQLMWFFLDVAVLREFLLSLRQENKEYFLPSNRSKLTVNILLPAYQISALRQ